MENVVWIARDEDGDLAIYENKPAQLEDGTWYSKVYTYTYINKKLFPEVTFENSPKQLILKQD